MHNDVEWQELKLKLMTHYWHTWAILNIYLNLLFRLGHKHVIIMLDYLWKHDGYLSNFPTYKNCDKIQYEGGVFFTFATILNSKRALWEVVTVENDDFFFGWIVLSDRYNQIYLEKWISNVSRMTLLMTLPYVLEGGCMFLKPVMCLK